MLITKHNLRTTMAGHVYTLFTCGGTRPPEPGSSDRCELRPYTRPHRKVSDSMASTCNKDKTQRSEQSQFG